MTTTSTAATAGAHAPTTLTEYERIGLETATCNLADGHAYQPLSAGQRDIVDRLPHVWAEAAAQTQPEAERAFKDAFSRLARTPSLQDHPHVCICPTASNSIDIIGAHLADRRLRTGLVEPTFDNLALLLARRGVDLVPVPEAAAYGGGTLPGPGDVGALFLVNPNNPTGRQLDEAAFRAVAEHCADHGMLLLLDNSFRFFVEQDYDQYAVLLRAGTSFISLEDTGKVWPTQELKASLMVFSADVAESVRTIYEEIYLCVSNFALGLIGEFMSDSACRGLDRTVWAEVAGRRARFRTALRGTGLTVAEGTEDSRLSVEWVTVTERFADDLCAVEALRHLGISVLPGRYFHWRAGGGPGTTDQVRFSLLREDADFDRALEILAAEAARRVG